ncbi:uncharacterized protein [Nicotiana sylvestris]|uniref:Uncharacterized protein LOC104229699 isoform X3 n=1 Tax=Nicotiana sylvestris TaxID=4096 RepID=A0A1U7WQ32_NICSY|nr:PREDICTED: uncharacterized protein LOC104229699 isoform X3 [Nicotiana sylvestris]
MFFSYEEIPLALDAAAVGVEIRVVGNDNGEKTKDLKRLKYFSKEMRTKQKGHKCDRISAEKSAELMQKKPEADYRKRRCERHMKAGEDTARRAVQE